jgi:hypothetical protein
VKDQGISAILTWVVPGDRKATDESDQFGALAGQFVVVVVVDQQGPGIGGMGVFEGLHDEFFAAGPRPTGVAQIIGAVIQRFIYDVSHGNATAVTPHHGVDMCLHAGREQVGAGHVRPVKIEPGRGSIVLDSASNAVRATASMPLNPG